MYELVKFPIKFRKYQNEIIKTFDDLRKKGDNRFHFVAPPGSGKTIVGLELIRRIGKKAVIFSPNSAIQIQWIQKLHDMTDQMQISANPKDLTDILSLTYQSITVKDRDTGELHENAKKIIDDLKDYHTIILDECHHLVAFWAEIINSLISDESIIIGLTATPPLDKSQREINAYLEIVNDVDYQIPLPAVIKEGNLAPFQDLIYISEPTDNELELLNQNDKKFKELLNKFKGFQAPLISIQHWIEDRIENYYDKKNKLIPFDELLKKNPDICIAFTRFCFKERGYIPLSVYIIDEMEEEPTIDDLMIVLEDYALNYLIKNEDTKIFYDELKNSLNEIGFNLTRNGIRQTKSDSVNVLGLSENKMIAMKEIIKQEMINLQEDLRCLVLTDYEKGKYLDGTSAISVMEYLTSDSETDKADPILVTGSTVLVDDDLLPHFLKYANDFFKQKNLNVDIEYEKKEGFYEVYGVGGDWNTKTYVLMITQMLELGLTRCLIGTRALLGEGWDSVKLNTLIDLTLVSTFVSVNQIRGRTLRKDTDNPIKVANNWDIVIIAKGIERGSYDFERVSKKHSQYYGLSDDNVIEKGIGHLHPLLTNINLSLLSAHKDDLNKYMFSKSMDRYSVYEKWKVGKPYKSYELLSLDFVPQKENIRYQIPQAKKKEIDDIRFIIKKRKKQSVLVPIFASVASLIGLYIMNVTFIINISLLVSINALSFFLLYFYRVRSYLSKRKAKLEENNTLNDVIIVFSHVIFDSLKEMKIIEENINENDIKCTKRDDGSYRVFLNNSQKSEIFAQSLSELLSPIQNQKYLIERKEIRTDNIIKRVIRNKITQTVLNYHPVPSILGKNRESAEIFKKYWNEYISDGELIYSRSKDGKDIIKKCFRKKNIELHQKKKDVWI